MSDTRGRYTPVTIVNLQDTDPNFSGLDKLLLQYDASEEEWNYVLPSVIGGDISLGDLSDVTLTPDPMTIVEQYDHLEWNGSVWENKPCLDLASSTSCMLKFIDTLSGLSNHITYAFDDTGVLGQRAATTSASIRFLSGANDGERSANYQYFSIYNTQTDPTGGNYDYLQVGYRSSPAYAYVIQALRDASVDDSRYPIIIRTYGRNQIHLDPDGEVGINCIPAGYQLDISGTTRASALYLDPSGTASPLSSFTFQNGNDPIWSARNEGGLISTLKWDGAVWTLANGIIVGGDITLTATSDLLFTTVGGNIGNGTDSNPMNGWFDGTLDVTGDITTLADINLSDGFDINFGTFGGTIGSDGVDSLDFTASLNSFTGDIECNQMAISETILAGAGLNMGYSVSDRAGVGINGGVTTTNLAPAGANVIGLNFAANYLPVGNLGGGVGGTKTISTVAGASIQTLVETSANQEGKNLIITECCSFCPNSMIFTIGAGSSKTMNAVSVASFKAVAPTLNNGATIADLYGLWVPDLDIAGVTNAYAIKTGTGAVDFGDTLNVTGVTTLSSGNVRAIRKATSTSAIATTDWTVLGSGTITLTLPSPVDGMVYNIKNVNTGVVTVATNGAEQIDGADTIDLSEDESITVQYYATDTDWAII
jgi:hypothetical protein